LVAKSPCRDISEVIFRFNDWKGTLTEDQNPILLFFSTSKALRLPAPQFSFPVVSMTAAGLKSSLRELDFDTIT
jgi:hypothetical protein